jgi:putative transposase
MNSEPPRASSAAPRDEFGTSEGLAPLPREMNSELPRGELRCPERRIRNFRGASSAAPRACFLDNFMKEKHTLLKEFGGVYFFTTRIYKKLHLFIKKEYIDVLNQAFEFAEKKYGIKTLIRVIMPNHIHWLFELPETDDDPMKIYQRLKSFTAKQIIELLKKELKDGELEVLELFKKNKRCVIFHAETILKQLKVKENNDGSEYQIWEKKPDLKFIDNEKILEQKYNYVFTNPTQKYWSLVENSEDYPYLDSSNE